MFYRFYRTRVLRDFARVYIEADSPEEAALKMEKIENEDALGDLEWKELDFDVDDEWIDSLFLDEHDGKHNRVALVYGSGAEAGAGEAPPQEEQS